MPRSKKVTESAKAPSPWRKYYLLFILPIVLSCIGLFFVFEASSLRALSESGSSFFYLQKQIIFLVIGIFLMLCLSFFNYHYWRALAFPAIVTVLILLIAVLIPGIGTKIGGARRWIDLGFFSLQPTEFAKMATIMYLASWFSVKEHKRFFSFLFLIGIIVFLVMMQPDMGTTTVIFSVSIIMYYLAGQDLRYLIGLIPVSVAGAVALIFAAPYRLKRLTAFLDPHSDPQGISYHINQVLISLANGGFTGTGLGASRQKYSFLPEAHTDSIFAILGEEVGFIGALLLIFLYFIFLYKMYELYNNTKDVFGKLLIGGIFAYFGMQMVTNMAAMTALMPLTGVPLPFISYGGSHMLTSFILIGITLNIARQEGKGAVTTSKPKKAKRTMLKKVT